MNSGGDEDLPLDAFGRLLGRLPSEDERERLRQARDALGIRPDDALWTVLLALQWHLVLYTEVPRRIERAAARAARQMVAAADSPATPVRSPGASWLAVAFSGLAGLVVGLGLATWYH